MFKLSRRKGSAKWQVRKRWPSDVAPILKGEFNRSTGEEDRKAAQAQLPYLAAEFEKAVAEARAKLAEAPREALSEAEAHSMAANFYRDMLPSYIVKRPLDPMQHKQLLRDTQQRRDAARTMLGRNDFGPVRAAARTLAQRAGLSLPEGSPAWESLHRSLMRAFVELHEAALANLSGNPDYTPSDATIRDTPTAAGGAPHCRTVENLIDAYEADKSPRWSESTKKAVKPVFRFMRDVFKGRAAASITREEARGAVKLLEGLPLAMGRKKELEGLSVPEAIKKAAKLGLPTIGPKTINDGYLLHIASLFNWARKEQWVASNPFEGLTVYDPVDDADRRDPFTAAQLQKLFTSGNWQGPYEEGKGRAGDYWVPLLCLFHGLRNAEAAGLRVEDIDEEVGHPVIRLQPYDTLVAKLHITFSIHLIHPTKEASMCRNEECAPPPP